MSGMACLRICIEHGARLLGEGVTPARIERTAALYLEARWRAPRRHGRVSPGGYVLFDPQVEELDSEELLQMAAELQLRLFGTQGRNDLCMLSYDADESAVQEFALLPEAELLAMRDGAPPPPIGRTRVICGGEVRELSPFYETRKTRPAAPLAQAAPAAPAVPVRWRGVYHLPSQRFGGSCAQPVPPPPARDAPPLEDADHMVLDFAGLTAAVVEARRRPDVNLVVGLRLWSLARANLREAYQARLAALDASVADRLSLMIYDMPRELPFSAINPIRDLPQRLAGRVNIRINDPEFYFQTLPEGLVQGVVLNLESEGEQQRLLALQRFLSQRPQYAARKLRQDVAGIRTRREMELCRDMGAVWALGPIVSALVDAPVAEQLCPMIKLPYRGPPEAP